MKKFILAGVIAVAVISTSCRKERTCECETTETTVHSGTVTDVDKSSVKQTVEKQKKREFITITNCYSTRESRVQNHGSGSNAHTDAITAETKCELK